MRLNKIISNTTCKFYETYFIYTKSITIKLTSLTSQASTLAKGIPKRDTCHRIIYSSHIFVYVNEPNVVLSKLLEFYLFFFI